MTFPPVRLDKYCPFIGCTLPLPHEHLCCQECGAVGHGNILCKVCHRQMISDLNLAMEIAYMEEERR